MALLQSGQDQKRQIADLVVYQLVPNQYLQRVSTNLLGVLDDENRLIGGRPILSLRSCQAGAPSESTFARFLSKNRKNSIVRQEKPAAQSLDVGSRAKRVVDLEKEKFWDFTSSLLTVTTCSMRPCRPQCPWRKKPQMQLCPS